MEELSLLCYTAVAEYNDAKEVRASLYESYIVDFVHSLKVLCLEGLTAWMDNSDTKNLQQMFNHEQEEEDEDDHDDMPEDSPSEVEEEDEEGDDGEEPSLSQASRSSLMPKDVFNPPSSSKLVSKSKTRRPRKRRRSPSLSESDSEEEADVIPMDQIKQILSPTKPKRKRRGKIQTGRHEMELVQFISNKSPSHALSWKDLTPGTKAMGQRDRGGLVNVMAQKLVNKPYSYMHMKKHLRVVAKNMTARELDTLTPSQWKGPFYVQSGGQHVRGVRQAMEQNEETKEILERDDFRPTYDLFGGKNMPQHLWQRLVTETQASEEIYSTWRFIEKIDIGRLYLKTWNKTVLRQPLSEEENKTISALFPKEKRKESLYARVRMMRCSDKEFDQMKQIDSMESQYCLAGQQQPKDWLSTKRQVCIYIIIEPISNHIISDWYTGAFVFNSILSAYRLQHTKNLFNLVLNAFFLSCEKSFEPCSSFE